MIHMVDVQWVFHGYPLLRFDANTGLMWYHNSILLDNEQIITSICQWSQILPCFCSTPFKKNLPHICSLISCQFILQQPPNNGPPHSPPKITQPNLGRNRPTSVGRLVAPSWHTEGTYALIQQEGGVIRRGIVFRCQRGLILGGKQNYQEMCVQTFSRVKGTRRWYIDK